MLIAKGEFAAADEHIQQLEAVLEKVAGTGMVSPTGYASLKRHATLLRVALLAQKGDRYKAIALARGLVASPPGSPDESSQALRAWLLLGEILRAS